MKKSSKGTSKNKKPKIIKITPEQLLQLTEAIRASNLDPTIGEMLIDNISGNRWLVNALEKGQLSIKKLRALFHITTESFENRRKRARSTGTSSSTTQEAEGASDLNPVQPESGEAGCSESVPKKRKGHGRIKADAYTGAVVIEVDHPH